MINILCLFCHPRHTVPEVLALSHHVEQVVQLVDVEEPGGRDIAIGPWRQAEAPGRKNSWLLLLRTRNL